MGRGHKSERKLTIRTITAPCEKEEEKPYSYPDWVVHIDDSINKGTTFQFESGRSWTIFRVPTTLRKVQESAFDPKIISIGPLHYKTDGPMYHHKMRHLLGLLGVKVEENNGSRTEEQIGPQYRKEVCLKELVDAMVKLEPKTRDCYPETFDNIDRERFVEMMVADGCFVIELLRLHYKFAVDKKRQSDASDGSSDSPIFKERWLLQSLQRDMMKLENQLPMFVLEKLFSMTASENVEPSDLHDLFMTFFCSMLSPNKYIHELDPNRRNYAHPLDLFRSSFIFSLRKNQERNEVHKIFIDIPKLIYSAQDLQEAGVAFIKKEDSTLLDISFDFDKGELQIPPLSIDENMIVALLNFVAYEQCDQSQKPIFTNYLLFLDSLINTTKDIEILRKNGIIWYPRGTEKEMADLFNNFCKGMLYSFDQTCLSVDMNAVNNYCEAFYRNKWRFWWSNLRRERFSSPWTFLSLLAAIVLLILTLLQTFFTIFPYYHPN